MTLLESIKFVLLEEAATVIDAHTLPFNSSFLGYHIPSKYAHCERSAV